MVSILLLFVMVFMPYKVLANVIAHYGSEVLKELPNVRGDITEDSRLDVVGLLSKYGYPFEIHHAQTEDGYIVTMHRIIGTKGEAVTQDSLSKKPVVFLMHGMSGSTAEWIISGVDAGLGYYMAKQGYDVWMGNARSNKYSRKHISLSPESDAFWKFSWDEIGYYDVPAMIDKALAVSGKTKLQYIGHSQGTTTFFVMTSRRPEYNDKIKSMHAMAPIAYMSNLKSPVMRLLAPFADTLGIIGSLIGINEFSPSSEFMNTVKQMLCKADSPLQPVCSNIMFLIHGFNPDSQNTTLLPVVLSHSSAGTSSRQMIHYAQLINSAKFRRYDHGKSENIKRYGSQTPPNYELKRVTVPVFLHYSDNDWMSAPEDVRQLNRELGNSVGMFRVPYDKFNHADYVFGINVTSLLYDRMVELIKKFE